jgi:hypothetical protein
MVARAGIQCLGRQWPITCVFVFCLPKVKDDSAGASSSLSNSTGPLGVRKISRRIITRSLPALSSVDERIVLSCHLPIKDPPRASGEPLTDVRPGLNAQSRDTRIHSFMHRRPAIASQGIVHLGFFPLFLLFFFGLQRCLGSAWKDLFKPGFLKPRNIESAMLGIITKWRGILPSLDPWPGGGCVTSSGFNGNEKLGHWQRPSQ